MAFSVGDIIAGAMPQAAAPNTNPAQGAMQGATGATNAGSSRAANGNPVNGMSNLYGAAAFIGLSLVVLWVGGGVILKGV